MYKFILNQYLLGKGEAYVWAARDKGYISTEEAEQIIGMKPRAAQITQDDFDSIRETLDPTEVDEESEGD